MEIIGPLALTLIAGLSTSLGYLFTYIKAKNINKFICISLSFASGIMALISIKELIPNSLSYIILTSNKYYSLSIILVIPIIIYLFINFFNKNINIQDSLYRVGILNMIALIIHNIPEGIITFMTSTINFKLGLKLALAIITHNIPEGIIISIPIYYATKNRLKAFFYTLIAGLSEVFGALIIYLLFKNLINMLIINIIMYIIGCLMIIIVIKDLIPAILKYNNIIWIMIGIVLSLFILII